MRPIKLVNTCCFEFPHFGSFENGHLLNWDPCTFLALEICEHQSRRRACETYKDGLLENERATDLVTGQNRVIFGAWARNFRKFLTFLHLVRQPSPHPSILRGEITLKACSFDRRTAKIQNFKIVFREKPASSSSKSKLLNSPL